MSGRFTVPPCVPIKPEALRVFRIDAGRTEHVRMLSAEVGGLFTHWTGRMSAYCDPDACPGSLHAKGQIWKGFVAAEVYAEQIRKWRPVVLEITEHLELDLRGVYARGQVWRLMRRPEQTRKREPVTGTLLEQLDGAAVPPAIDVRPVLMYVFHVQRLALDVMNPLPPRIMVAPSEGAPPPGIGTRKQQSESASAEEWQKLRKLADPSYEPKKNGAVK